MRGKVPDPKSLASNPARQTGSILSYHRLVLPGVLVDDSVSFRFRSELAVISQLLPILASSSRYNSPSAFFVIPAATAAACSIPQRKREREILAVLNFP